MIDLFLPLIIGITIGIDPPAQQADPPQNVARVAPAVQPDQGSGDDLGPDRAPEPQIPTGKYTTAIEIRPILDMTKSSWAGVREFQGQDLIYFSHLLAWRCGLWDISFGINGAPAQTVVVMEPCNDDYAQPNAMIDLQTYQPYVSYPLGEVESIYIEIVYDDGTSDFAQFNRDEIRIP